MAYIFLLLMVIFHLSLPAVAKQKETQAGNYHKKTGPKKIGEFEDWRAFVSEENSKKICYIISFSKTQEGNYKKRGKPYIMITHRPDDKSYNVVSVHAGYKFLKDSKPQVIIMIGKTKKEYELFVKGESAWAPSDEIDQELTKMITKQGESLIVKGESFKGTKIKDTYSLKGSLAAYKAISQECNFKF